MFTAADLAEVRSRYAEIPRVIRPVVWLAIGARWAAPYIVGAAPISWLIGIPWKWFAAFAWLLVIGCASRSHAKVIAYLT